MTFENAIDYEQSGQFLKALQVIENNLDTEDIDLLLLKARLLSYNDELKKSLDSLDQFKESSAQSELKFKILITKSMILTNFGKYKDVERVIAEIQAVSLHERKDDNDSINLYHALFEVTNCFIQIKLGNNSNYEKIYTESQKIVKKAKNGTFLNYIDSLLGLIYQEKGELDKSEKIFSNLLKRNKKLSNSYEISRALLQLGIIQAKKGNLDEAKNLFEEAYDILKKQNYDKTDQAKILNNLGIVMRYLGELTKSLSYFYKALDLSNETGNSVVSLIASSNIGILQLDNGLLDDALDTYNAIIPTAETLGDTPKLASFYTNLGVIYRKKGDFASALEYYSKGFTLKKKVGNKGEIASTMQGIAIIHLTQGDIGIAIGYLEEALDIWKMLGNEEQIASVEKDIGIAYQKKGNQEKCLEHLKISLDIRKKLGNEYRIAESLFYYIVAGLESDQKEFANYLKELHELAKKTPLPDVKTKAILAQAMFLQQGDSLMDQVKAHELLEEVLAKSNIDSEIRILAMLNLCEYLVIELKVTNETEIIHEIRALLDKLYAMATEQESHTLLIKILIIEAKLELIELNVNQAISILESALQIAESYGIDQSKLEITYLLERMNGEIKRVINSKVSLDKRIEMVELESYIREVAALKSTVDDSPSSFDDDDPKQLLQVNLNLVQMLSEDKNIPNSLKKRLYFSHLSKKEIQLLMSTYLTMDLIENRSYSLFPQKINSISFIKERITGWEKLFDRNRIKINFYNLQDEIIITADKILITRVFDNIIHNALKFTPDKEEFGINVIENNGFWVFTFFNSCPLIELNDINQLFDKYTQYDFGAQMHNKKGIGLGLTFCKKAIELHEGSISIQSPIPNRENGFQLELKIPV